MANYFVLLDCFPLFLHSLTCLVKLILWLVFPQTKGRRRKQSSAPLQKLPFGEKASPDCPLSGVWAFQASSLGEGNRCFLPLCPSLRTVWKSMKPSSGWEFPGGPMVRTCCFHCCGLSWIPVQITKILQAVWHDKERKKKEQWLCGSGIQGHQQPLIWPLWGPQTPPKWSGC